VKPWCVVQLCLHNIQHIINQVDLHNNPEDWEFDGSSESPRNLVVVEDNFAVLALPGNEVGVDFFVLQCQRKKYQVQVDFECPWNGDFKIEDFVGEKLVCERGAGSRDFISKLFEILTTMAR
jgi:hypothetical protein